MSPNVEKIDKIIHAADPIPQTDQPIPTGTNNISQTKVVVPDHLWNTRYLRHHKSHPPNHIYR